MVSSAQLTASMATLWKAITFRWLDSNRQVGWKPTSKTVENQPPDSARTPTTIAVYAADLSQYLVADLQHYLALGHEARRQ